MNETLRRWSVVPGQTETVARRIRSAACVLQKSEPSSRLNSDDLPALVQPIRYTSPRKPQSFLWHTHPNQKETNQIHRWIPPPPPPLPPPNFLFFLKKKKKKDLLDARDELLDAVAGGGADQGDVADVGGAEAGRRRHAGGQTPARLLQVAGAVLGQQVHLVQQIG